MGKQTRKGSGKGFWWTRWLIVGLLPLVLIWFAPGIIANSPLCPWIAGQVLADLQGTVTVGEVSLGWLAPVVVNEVQIHDNRGELLLSVPRAESSHTLLGLITSRTDLGSFRCERPFLSVVFSEGSNNLERAFAGYLQPGEPTASPKLDLEVISATIRLRDRAAEQEWTLEPVHFSLSLAPAAPIRVKCSASLKDDPGKIQGELSIQEMQSGAVSLQVENLPLALAGPLLRRLDKTTLLEGRINGRIKGTWNGEKGKTTQADLDSQITLSQLVVAGSWLKTDRIQLEKVELPCQARLTGTTVQVQRADLTCDLGRASAKGMLDLGSGVAGLADHARLEASADMDVTRLAQMLPATLGLRENTQITSGRVRFDVRSTGENQGTVWEGKLHSTDLRGVAQGQPFAWSEPLDVAFRGRFSPDTLPQVELLKCQSSFLQAEASSAGEQWTVTATYDLSQLAQQLSQFLDLGPVRLAGKGSTRVTVRPGPQNTFRLEGQSSLHQLELLGLGKHPIEEETLNLTLEAEGAPGGKGLFQVQNASARLEVGGDTLRFRLLEPAQVEQEGPSANLGLDLEGDLSRWKKRLHPLVAGLDSLKLSGKAELSARFHLHPHHVDLQESRLTLNDVRCIGYGLSIQEPRLSGSARGRLELASGDARLSDLQLTSPTLSLHMPRLDVSPSSGEAVPLSGDGTVQADLARLQKWFQRPAPAASESLHGNVSGKVTLQPVGDRLGIGIDLGGKNLTLGLPANPYWREREVRLRGQGAYEPGQDLLHLSKIILVGDALQVDGSGQLARVASTQDVSLQGQVQFDLEKLSPNLRVYLGNGVKIQGTGSRRFFLKGPLAGTPPERGGRFSALQGETALRWQRLDVYGGQCGPAEMPVQLKKSWLVAQPLQTTINQGTLRLQPRVRLEPWPVELILGQGKAIDRAHITPEMCEGAIKYAVPALAGMTQGKGEMSLELKHARLPLDNPARAEAEGAVTIHHARIGATAPLIRELSVLLQRPAEARFSQQSVIPFRVVKGRVYHERLELVFPELTVRTRGSVGLDGSLDLVGEFPVPAKWLGTGKIDQSLAKQTITVPIKGTLENPQLDRQALRAASAQLLQQSAQDLLGKEIENRLEKILPPIR